MKRSEADAAPTKGERTRRRIVERTAPVFNKAGFTRASMSDVTRASGLERGGVYNHFASKETLALAAFDYAVDLMQRRWLAAARDPDPLCKLEGLVDVYREIADNPPLGGGCPLMNAAIEADDAHPVLRNRVRKAMDGWQRLLAATIEEAIAAKRLAALDSKAFASTIVATLEGGVMLSSLYRDPSYLRTVVAHLLQCIAAQTLPADSDVSPSR
jgi:TetR/AcrR family transcriptional repressor of nem operon